MPSFPTKQWRRQDCFLRGQTGSSCGSNLLHVAEDRAGGMLARKMFEIESSKTPFHGHLKLKIALHEFPFTACPYVREKSIKSLKTHQITKLFSHLLVSAIVAIYQATRQFPGISC